MPSSFRGFFRLLVSVFLPLGVLLAAPPAGSGRDLLPPAIRASGVIRVGSQATFPPIEFREEGRAEVSGLSADLLREISARLGCRIAWVHAEYAGLISGLQAGRFDLVSGGMSDTPEREAKLDFVNYFHSGAGILLLADHAPADGIEDLSGRTAATMLGSRVIAEAVQAANQKLAARGRPPIQLVQLPAATDARLQLDLRRVDAYLGDLPALLYLCSRFPGKYRLAGRQYTFADYISSWGFAKSDPGLRDAILLTARDLLQDGTYARLLAKWGCTGFGLPAITLNQPAHQGK
ncbi:MAG TPA: ABC transporter substrate-binding protein [Holophaga sp.]|nr:ABC transporter substrate-binding protein [Holophaga sp.]